VALVASVVPALASRHHHHRDHGGGAVGSGANAEAGHDAKKHHKGAHRHRGNGHHRRHHRRHHRHHDGRHHHKGTHHHKGRKAEDGTASYDTIDGVPTDLRALCPGYAEERIPVEAQAWWFPTGEDSGGTYTGLSFGHSHMKACVPTITGGNEIASDQLRLDLTFTLHTGMGIPDVPSDAVVKVSEIEMRGRNDTTRDVLVDEFLGTYLTCAAGQTCTATVPLTFDLFDSPRICQCASYKHGLTSPGLKQIRISAFSDIYVDGKKVDRMRAGLRVPINFDPQPSPVDADWSNMIRNYNDDTESAGWFIKLTRDGAGGYATARYTQPIPTAARSSDGSWTLPLEFEPDPCPNNCAVSRMPITGYEVRLDPDIHNGIEGETVAREMWAPTTGTVKRSPTVHWSYLAPGLHKLVVIVHQPMVDGRLTTKATKTQAAGTPFDVPSVDESTLQGVLVLFFLVN
jgi:hypothetical protein